MSRFDRAVMFVRNMANMCRGCMRRSEQNCNGCLGRDALEIARELDSDPGAKPVLMMSTYEYAQRIVAQMRKIGRPVHSYEIDAMGRSPQYKYKIIANLVGMGIVKCSREANRVKVYELRESAKNDGTEQRDDGRNSEE